MSIVVITESTISRFDSNVGLLPPGRFVSGHGSKERIDRREHESHPARLVLKVVQGMVSLQLFPESRPRDDPSKIFRAKGKRNTQLVTAFHADKVVANALKEGHFVSICASSESSLLPPRSTTVPSCNQVTRTHMQAITCKQSVAFGSSLKPL